LERWTFERKGEFFESVFGVQPELKGRLKLWTLRNQVILTTGN
jgi:hypothetical protein